VLLQVLYNKCINANKVSSADSILKKIIKKMVKTKITLPLGRKIILKII